MRLAGKTALITGAASGIGRAAAMLFAEEGANVALNDVRSLSAYEGQLDRAVYSEHIADVSVPDAVERMVEEVLERWGRLDIVLANAGINRDGFLEKLSDENWDEVLRVNLGGPFLLCRAAFPRLEDGGSVVVTSSVSALGNIGKVNYAASKAGLIGLTRSAALEGASRRVRVNAVAPGFTNTRMGG